MPPAVSPPAVSPPAVLLAVVLLAAWLAASGCASHSHTVGDGPQGGDVYTAGVWYAAYGFVPLSSFDSRQVVGAARDYRVQSYAGVFDVFVNLVLGPLGFVRRTVRVEE